MLRYRVSNSLGKLICPSLRGPIHNLARLWPRAPLTMPLPVPVQKTSYSTVSENIYKSSIVPRDTCLDLSLGVDSSGRSSSRGLSRGAVIGLALSLIALVSSVAEAKEKEQEGKENNISDGGKDIRKGAARKEGEVNDSVMLPPFNAEEVRKELETPEDPPSFFQRWSMRFRMLFRSIHLALVFTPALLLLPIAQISGFGNSLWWRYIRWCLEHLGGAWIKLGQWASTRPDLFSPEVISRLSSLCRDVYPHSFRHTERALREALPAEKVKVFKSLSATPVASGAIAQVYHGTLYDGREVAVKVLHPGIERAIKTDLNIMAVGAYLLELIPGMKWLSFSDSIAQFTETMQNQANLKMEALNLHRFVENFKDHSNIVFPKPIFSDKSVLIETWEGGIGLSQLLSEADPALNKRIAKIGLHAYLKMMLLDNFVHADLHPGNIALRKDGEKLSLVFYDVGLATEATETDWDHFKQLFKAIITGNGQYGAELMIDFARSNAIKPEERAKFTKEMHDLFEPLRNAPLKDVDVGFILQSVLSLVRKYRVQIEGNFATLCVGTAVLEGIGRQLDPDLNLLGEAVPYFNDSPLKETRNEVLAESSSTRRADLVKTWVKSKFETSQRQ